MRWVWHHSGTAGWVLWVSTVDSCCVCAAQFGNAEKLAAVCIEAAAASAQWTSFEQMLLWKFVHAEFTEWSKYAPTPVDHLTSRTRDSAPTAAGPACGPGRAVRVGAAS